MHNPNFNYGEYAIIRDQSGLNSYKISVKKRIAKTNTINLALTAYNIMRDMASFEDAGLLGSE